MIATWVLGEGAPLEPDREQARQWAVDELSSGRYAAAEPNWLSKALTWVGDRLSEFLSSLVGQSGSLNIVLAWVVALAIVAVIVLVFWRFGSLSRTATAPRADDLFGAEPELSAEEHRRRAEAAQRSGEHGEAVVEWFRAIVRELENRTVLAPRPGRTAHEAAWEAAPAIGDAAPAVRRAADLFDGVRYGRRPVGEQESAQAAQAFAQVRAARVSLL